MSILLWGHVCYLIVRLALGMWPAQVSKTASHPVVDDCRPKSLKVGHTFGEQIHDLHDTLITIAAVYALTQVEGLLTGHEGDKSDEKVPSEPIVTELMLSGHLDQSSTHQLLQPALLQTRGTNSDGSHLLPCMVFRRYCEQC